MSIMQFIVLRPIGFFSPLMLIVIISALFITTVLVQFKEYKKNGKVWTYYPVGGFIFFAPIYEEILFRGFIFIGLLQTHSILFALVVSSLLFGFWHLKNIFWLPRGKSIEQMLYTGLIFGPIMAGVTLFTGTIWTAVIFHYINNLLYKVSFKKAK